MTITHSKLGNGFVINAADSTLDQEHYFGGAKKHIEMKVVPLTGTQADAAGATYVHWSTEGNILYVTGSYKVVLSGTLFDANNVKIGFTESSRYTGLGYTTVYDKLSLGLYMEASGAVEMHFSCSRGTITNLESTGTLTPLTGGWNRYEYTPKDHEKVAFAMSLLDASGKDVHWIVSGSANGVSAFKKFSYRFLQELSDDGVKYLKDLDNQNTEKISYYVNRHIMPEID